MTSNQTQLRGVYLVLDGAQAGPFNFDELAQLREQGRLTENVLAWKAGMGAWTPAGQMAAFDGFFVVSPPPIPVTPAAPAAAQNTLSQQGSVKSEAAEQESADEGWFSSAPAPAASAKPTKRRTTVRGRAERAPEHQQKKEEDPFAALMAKEAAEAEQRGQGRDEDARDPFLALADDDASGAGVEVGEQTRFFMIQAGMTQKQRNPPWKIALFIGLFILIPSLAVFTLSRISVEQTYFDIETGKQEKVQVTALEEVSESFSGLRDKLMGVEKTKKEIEEAKAKRLSSIRKKQRRKKQDKNLGDGRLEMPTDVAVGAGAPHLMQRMDDGSSVETIDFKEATNDSDRARAIYSSGHKMMTKGPISRVPDKDATALNTSAAQLSADVLSKVIANNQKAFQACVQNELRRNPAFKGGKIMLSLTIGSSGLVTQTAIDNPEIDKTVIGSCIKTSARRIVFPSFEGDPFTVEFPLLLSSGY